ncbi:MAG: 30S ribosomal protein S6 [Candidatus Kryptoniota bacterium]
MNTSQKEYETTYIINSNLEDSQIESIITRYTELVTSNGGEVTSIDRWGRKRLAYPIRKKNAGFYVQMNYRAPSDIVKKLESTFKLDEEIVRYLTVSVNKNMKKARAGIKEVHHQHMVRTDQSDQSEEPAKE